MENRWFKNAVIYSVDVDTFRDGNGDGIGDFIGLRQGLSYLAGLGVTCVWLLPFYDSPDRDDGTTSRIISRFIRIWVILATSPISCRKLMIVVFA